MMDDERVEVEAFYRRYLARCNAHRFGELDEFVDEHVAVNGEPADRRRYGDGLASVVAAFGDFHWDLRRLLVDGEFLSAFLIDTGTSRDGRSITLREFALYRLAGGRIVEVWGDLDPDRLSAATREMEE